MRAIRTLPLIAAVALVLTACASTSTPSDDSADSDASDSTTTEIPGDPDAFPVTIEHAYGETVIDELPERVATVGWSNHEVPLALGVVPVIFEKATWGDDDGDGVLPWVREKLDELGVDEPTMYDPTDGIDFAAISDADPDVILASYSGLTQEDYDTLSAIAPVVAYPDVAWGTTYEEMIEMNSTAIGLAPEGEALIDELDTTVTDTFAEYPDLAGTSVLFASFSADDLSQVGYYTSNDTRPKFLDTYGMPFSTLVAESGDASESFYETISAESVESLEDVDLIVTYADESLLETLQADPLLSKIPAIADGNVVFLGLDGPVAASANPSPLSIPSTIGEYVAMLDAAATGGE